MGFWDGYRGDRHKFVEPGDTIEGEITRLSVADFGDGPVPVVTVGDKEVTCSQRVLQMRLAELGPVVGDWVKITYDGENTAGARPGRSPAKMFTVVTKQAGAGTPTTETEAGTEFGDDSEPF